MIAAGLVTGALGAGSSGSILDWAIFVDPPGDHLAPSTVPAAKPEVLNWYTGFVSLRTKRQPLCTFGRAANLPPLPRLVPAEAGVPSVAAGAR